MRQLILLLFFVGVACSQLADTNTANAGPPEQLSDVSLSDYMNSIKAIEDTAFEQIKNVHEQAEAAKEELYASWGARIKQIMKDKMIKDAEKALQLEMLKQQMIDNYKAETEKVFQQAVAAAQEYKQAYAAAKEAQRQKVIDRVNEFKQRVNESIEAHRAQVRANLEEVNVYLQQVDALYAKHKAENEAQVEERRQALKDKLTTLFGDLQTRKTDLDAQETQLKENLKAFIEQKYAFMQDANGAKKEVEKEVATEFLERELEKKLDKELKDLVKDEVKAKFKHPKLVLGGGSVVETATVIAPAYKATLLDTLTGASAWETVAWVLLALCILLSVALIALIAYQLDGIDSPHRASVVIRGNERAPLNSAPPLHYTQEKSSPLAGPSVTAALQDRPAPSPIALTDILVDAFTICQTFILSVFVFAKVFFTPSSQ
ncbi:unnamed protein product, partial [Mesorhabditis belari]|uniref:Uncharacterized protein n=1 Tax=Mesorhabditis belari TaxID=2138241 RepID=A0AAF3JBR2_9BILA